MKKFSLTIIGIIMISLILSSCKNMAEPYGAQNRADVPSSVDKLVFSDMQPMQSSYALWDGTLPPVSTMEAIDFTGNYFAPTSAAVGGNDGINLTIPQKLDVTRPAGKITTTYDKYFIMGTSDPELPVYIGDTKIERQGSKGVFGVFVNLNLGTNKFTFSQGDKSKIVTITRKAYVNPAAVPITGIQQSSMVPAVFSGVKVGGELELSCIAPSGASVTATFNGQSVKLKQVAQAKAGVPATFKAMLPVNGSYDDDATRKIGKVQYSLEYNGKTENYTSTGDVYVAGKNSNVAVRLTSYMGFVYPNLNNLSIIKEKLKIGAVDFLKSQDNTYAGLASGGYVSKEHLEVVTGKVSVGNKFSKVRFSGKSKSESYTFTGTNNPAYVTKLSDGKFSITFYNTTGEPKPDVAKSKLFSDVSISSGERYVTYSFTQKNSNLWGYVIDYTENGTVLTFKYKPKLSSGSTPFEGITVILDPGHGGTDKGALGFAPLTGPTETDVNLAHAYATRDVLESMGAKVAFTRRQDVFFSLDDRLRAQEATGADIYVSIHHNSIGENVDANKVSGVEIYYHTAMSKRLANSMMAAVTTDTNRKPRFVQQSYYRVTLSPYSPSILLELGYISNPLEYERAANNAQIKKAAEAIAEGIVNALQN